MAQCIFINGRKFYATPALERAKSGTLQLQSFELGTMKGTICLTTYLVAAVLIANSAYSAPLTVDREKLACVVKNADRYLESTNDPIIVFLDFCPDVSPSVDDIMRKAENSTMPNLKSGNGTGVTSVLPLRKEEIKCLVNQANELKIFSSQAFVTLPVNLCKR